MKTSILYILITMAVAFSSLIPKIKQRVKHDIADLICHDVKHGTASGKACCACDKLLRYRQFDQISLPQLRKCQWAKPELNFKNEIIEYYRIKNASLKQQFSEIGSLFISPSSVCTMTETGKPQFAICNECNNNLKMPPFCIKRFPFGIAPKVLTDLNEVELVLVSQGRIDRHIFQIFAGQHKCIKLWHQMFESNLEHTMASFERLTEYKLPEALVCTLSGPFTSKQKALAFERVNINRTKVMAALKWLIENNLLYAHLRLPDDVTFPEPLIIDHSELVEEQDTKIETVFETSVIFPQTGEVHSNNGGCDKKETYLKNVLKHKLQTQMISRPTQNVLPLFEGDNLGKCFPLQFPFGLGVKPPKVNLLDYLKHLVQLSIPAFQESSMILPLFNLYAKSFAVGKASIRCNYKIGKDKNTGDVVNNITADEIKQRVTDLEHGRRTGSFDTQMFMNSVYAISKTLPFTDEAAKEERRKIFSLCTYYGLPSIFFTVTPDDLENFRIVVYSTQTGTPLPPNIDVPIPDIDAYLTKCAEIRVKYPGLCEYDFENIIDIVIQQIIGWDIKDNVPNTEGGAFGNCEAYFTPVEEQGRKTLHSHFLLWIKDWNSLLSRLYSLDKVVRKHAGIELAVFADNVVSTQCFALHSDLKQRNTFVEKAKLHDCDCRTFQGCSVQQVRNMRYQHCDKTLQQKALVFCTDCDERFDLDKLVESVAFQLLDEKGIKMTPEDLKTSVKIILLHENTQLPDSQSPLSAHAKNFFIQALRNLHLQTHTFTCFKKGSECRSRMPNRAADSTQVHFFENEVFEWYDWKGVRQDRIPYLLEPKRHPFDLFVNTYNPTTSELLQCNCNVQLGIDGAHMMYCTCYATKSNRKEEKEAMICACEGLLRQIKKEQRDAEQAEDIGMEPPVVSAFKRMLCSVLTSTQDYIISAPLAKYMMLHGTRFRSSHQFTNIPFFDFKNSASTEAKLHFNLSNKAFISSSRDTYLFRAPALSSLSVSEFYAKYHAIGKSKKDNNADLKFTGNAPIGYKNLRLRKRDIPTIPIIYHEMMEDAKAFGGNIFSNQLRDAATLELREVFCQKVLILFKPFRHEAELKQVNNSYFETLAQAMEDDEMDPQFELYMNNMQDCRNSLNAGRMEDMVERATNSLPDPDAKDSKKQSREQTEEVLKFLDEKLSRLVADISDACGEETDSETNATGMSVNIDLNHIRERGTYNCGMDRPIPHIFDSSNESTFIHTGDDGETDPEAKRRKTDSYWSPTPNLSFDKLLEVSCLQVTRNIISQDAELEACLDNINATGSIESILEWGRVAFTDVHGVTDIAQVQAFQSIVAEFVLTYLNSVDTNLGLSAVNGSTEHRAAVLKWKRSLLRLRGLDVKKDKENLVMFLTGPGGSGKSHVIKNVLLYSSKFCDLIKQPFDRRTIVVTAMTGVAAVSILGETMHSALSINARGGIQADLKSKTGASRKNEWANARIIIIDEISFASKQDLTNITKALEILKQEKRKHYGGMGMIFTGDFYQLEPINGNSLYKNSSFAPWFDWVNCFVELEGGHRFPDKTYFRLLRRLRLGQLTESDFDLLDSRVLGKESGLSIDDIPPGTPIATQSNADRCAMNNAIFAYHLQTTHSKTETDPIPKHTMLIRSFNHQWRHSDNPISVKSIQDICQRCGDCDLQTPMKKYVDPLLKLYLGVLLMLTENKDVTNGIANGTIAKLKRIVLHPGNEDKIETVRVDGYYVNGIDARYVEGLILELETGEEYLLESQAHVVEANLPINLMPEFTREKRYKVGLKLNQFPVLLNHATTVHKLQGLTRKALYVAALSYSANWVYVALSRIQTLDGLFLRRKLSRNKNYRPHGLLVAMMRHMTSKKPIPYDDDD